MITIIATALLSMAAMKGDAMDNARKAFNGNQRRLIVLRLDMGSTFRLPTILR